MSLSPATVAAYLGIVTIGSFVQALTGFALGLIVLGAATALNLASISFSAAVISLFGMANGLWVLRSHHEHIHWPVTLRMTTGMVPGVMLGLYLLRHIEVATPVLLHHGLGGFLVLAGLLLMARPHPFQRESHGLWGLLAGLAGGIFAGLFSAPIPFVLYLYRQPLPIRTIRATLIIVFVFATGWRIIWLTARGGMSGQMVVLGLLALPAIVISAHLALRLSHHVPPLTMRRLSFALLVALGLTLLLN